MVKNETVGRCGNFLFQVAAGLAYALKHGLDFTVPDRTRDHKWNPIYMQHLVNRRWNPRLHTIHIYEQGHAYQEIPFDEELVNTFKERGRSVNIILHGYWQSEKYFIDYREEVLKAFAIPYNRNKGVVSVHVRRGDYLQYPDKHPPVSLDWYMEAVRYFELKGYNNFIVFSDDINWCKENFIGKKFEFSEGNNEMKDLELMSNCYHQINSSSTFSWWGAWLNRNPTKIVLTPKLWFVEGHGGLDVSDIVPLSWQKV